MRTQTTFQEDEAEEAIARQSSACAEDEPQIVGLQPSGRSIKLPYEVLRRQSENSPDVPLPKGWTQL